MSENDLAQIPHWLRLDERLTTSGQPSEEDLATLARDGVRCVVNLGLHSHPQALADERASVEALGMVYVHIPVAFDRPTEDDFAAFGAAMAAHANARLHVHCIMNKRVSAFLYRYRRDALGMDEAMARADMQRIWTPDGVWADVIAPRG